MSDHAFKICSYALQFILLVLQINQLNNSLSSLPSASKRKLFKSGSCSSNHSLSKIKRTRIASSYSISSEYDMAQPATKRTPLGIDAFWDKSAPDPHLHWEKWRVQYKLVVLAKENIILDTLLRPKPEMVEFPLEPISEETIVGASAQSESERERERERNARNAKQKLNWQNKCQRLIEVGIMCGDKPWPLAGCKTLSLLNLSIGVEGCRILNCKNSHIMINALTTVDFWKIVEEAFIRPRNINFDRHFFLITKQLRGEAVEHF